MFWRLAGVVVSVAVCGMWVLSLRHNRVQAMSELTQAQLRINKQDEKLWVLRSRIAGKVTPPEIERLCADVGVGPMHAILPYSPAEGPTVAMVPVVGGPVATLAGPQAKPMTPAGSPPAKSSTKAGTGKPTTPTTPTNSTTSKAGKPTTNTKSTKTPAKREAAKPATKPASKPGMRESGGTRTGTSGARPPARIATKLSPQG